MTRSTGIPQFKSASSIPDYTALTACAIGGLVCVTGIACFVHAMFAADTAGHNKLIPAALIVTGALLATNHRILRFEFWKGFLTIQTDNVSPRLSPLKPKTLTPDLENARRTMARRLSVQIPGLTAAPFKLLDAGTVERTAPAADPFTPMYRLDKDYRIVDWNTAFALAFDRTMEGHRGQSVMEWLYYLDNFEASLAHGIDAFKDAQNLPRLDVEPLVYTSERYGRIEAEKRAYQIPQEAGGVDSWLCILDPRFHDEEQATAYYIDLAQMLGEDLLWSEYAFSYDRVLNNTDVYPALLAEMLGQSSPGDDGVPLGPIPSGTRVLDLGAGTGNITRALAEPAQQRTVVAIDKNRMMLKALRYKCRGLLRENAAGPGVFVTRQDVVSLFGLDDNSFDYAILNNVLYAVDSPDACLREIHRVLKAGGAVRISGPRRDTNLDRLFAQMKKELIARNRYEEVARDFARVENINKSRLSRLLYKWTVEDVEQMVRNAGFGRIVYCNPEAYGGEGMIVAAIK